MRLRSDLARDVGVVALILVTAAGWVLASGVVRHQAGAEPLFWRTVALHGAEPAGGAAWRAILPATAAVAAPRDLEILERGRPLERARPREVREEGAGHFAVGAGGELLFAPSTAAPLDVRDYTVRMPREVPASVVRAAALALIVLTLVSLLVIARGMARSQVLGRTAAGVALATAGWMVVATVMKTTTPWLGADLIGQKLSVLASDVDDYDAVFLGSSRIYRQLDPLVFDQVFAGAGIPMRSFNLGAPDMRMLEVLHLARWLLGQSPRRLELLVIDAESDPLFIREQNLTSERIVRWHDPRNAAAIVGEVRRTAESPAAALHRASRHGAPLLLHVTQLGRGHGLLRQLTGALEIEFPLEQRGFFAGDEELATTPSVSQREELELFSRRLHGDLERYRRDIESLTRQPSSGALTDRFEIELFGELERLAAGAGVRTVFLLDAQPERKPNLVWAAENDVISTLLRFDDPERYPELYDPALRFDRHHLSKEGARLYTAEVARRILEPSS